MTSAEEQSLRTLSLTQSPVAANAKAILYWVFGDPLPDEVTLPPEARLRSTEVSAQLEQAGLLLFPNPAQREVEIAYRLPEEQSSGTLRLINLQGQVLRSENLQNDQGQLNWMISNLPSGVYLVQLQSKGYTLATHKLMVQAK